MSGQPATYRRHVRERALEVAHELTTAHGWDQVRVGAVATATGVSRPTLYKEFGNKQGLGEALVLREGERFLTGVAERLAAHGPDLEAGIDAAISFTMNEAERSPLLHAVLTSGNGGDDSLLPFLTTRSAPLIEAATTSLIGWFREHAPDIDDQVLRASVDALVRLIVSHLVLPAADPAQTPGQLTRLALRSLRPA